MAMGRNTNISGFAWNATSAAAKCNLCWKNARSYNPYDAALFS